MPHRPQTENHRFFISHLGFALWILLGVSTLYAAEIKAKGPIIINGDNVEYATEKKEVTASGNVVVICNETRLTCQKLTVNTDTKEARAEGNVRIEEAGGIIEGTSATYNFQTKSGVITDAGFESNPFFGKADKIEKVNDTEFIAEKGYATTCNFDHPHFKLKAKKVDFFPQEKVEIKSVTAYAGNVPVLYLPKFVQNFEDPLMNVQLMPGYKKDWGSFMESAWRYRLNDYMTGRIYLDYRQDLGWAEGFGENYTTPDFGKGDLKFYYTDEDDKNQPQGQPSQFRRYFVRWRHKWDIDSQTEVTSEYYKIVDSKRKELGTDFNILKDYFPREYEKDTLPLSYALFHHSFSNATADIIVQPRTNAWYSEIEKMPEVRYSMPSVQMGDTQFYFDNATTFASYNSVPDGANMIRLDSTNKFSRPFRVAFINLTPFVASRETVYDRDINGNPIAPRTIFYTGADASTKFYRLFNVNSNLLGLDINGLRHIITPSIGYAYNHQPTIPTSNLRQIDSVDSITTSNAATLQLSNKLQTKRNGISVDLVDTLVTTNYVFKPNNTADKHGGNLSDILYKMKLLPYSWLRIEADATYNRSTSRSDPSYNRFTTANYDLVFDFQKDRSFRIGQRYERGGANQITGSLIWRLNPKWTISIYERFAAGHDPNMIRGLQEQQFGISRDLHCWIMDIGLDTQKGHGVTIWCSFMLKAFPQLELGSRRQSYHDPRSGSQ
jgi:hypothetical protein